MNSIQTWIQTFGYDRYGNRTSHSETVHGQAKAINKVTLPAVDVNTNKFSNTTDYEFDAVGNLIRDIHGRQFVFNGENKQVQVRDAQNNVVGEYVYDGNAKRVKKIKGTEYIVFVYDGFGKLIGEYSTAGPPANPMVHYTATDQLGSPRVLTNENGEIISRRDFMPFGEEIAPDATYRTAAHKYGVTDNVRQKFTGYERDAETGLDFAEARYYYNNHGRFTAVDPLLASGKSANPQTFNRYAYTMNRPLILTDATGLQAGQTAPPLRPVVLPPKPDSYYSVSGSTANEAWDNALKNRGGHRAITKWDIVRNVDFETSYTYDAERKGYIVTATISGGTVSVQTSVTMPQWEGFGAASAAEQSSWNALAGDLRDHEIGHEEIAVQGIDGVASALNEAMPLTVTAFVESAQVDLKDGKAKEGLEKKLNTAVNNNLNKILDPVQRAAEAVIQNRSDQYDDQTDDGAKPRRRLNE